jgi:hypothetical protein
MAPIKQDNQNLATILQIFEVVTGLCTNGDDYDYDAVVGALQNTSWVPA